MGHRLLVLASALLIATATLTGAPPSSAAGPEAPTISGLSVASAQLTITFPAVTGATSYQYSLNGGSSVTAAGSPLTITGLTNGQTYCVALFAQNMDGTSTSSNVRCGVPNNPATPGSVAPVITAVSASSSSLTVSYTRADDGFAIDTYQVWLNGSLFTTLYDFASPLTIPGLSADSAYAVQIKAQGPGTAPDSTKSAPFSARTEAGAPPPAPRISLPEPPGVVIRSVGDASISFTLNPPVNNGGEIPYNYRFSIDDRTVEVNPANLDHTITGLRNGTVYTITANAQNSAGWSAPGVATATPIGPASAPRDVRASARVRGAVVTWSAPDNDGGRSVTGYTVRLGDGTVVCSTDAAARTCDVTTLLSRTGYVLTVAAETALGTGVRSVPVPVTTPVASPTQPRDFRVIANPPARRSVRLSWLPPADTGGGLIRYRVTYESEDRRSGRSTCYVTTTTCTIDNIMPNKPYNYTLIASHGSYESASARTFTLSNESPRPPRSAAARQVDDRIRVTWDPPRNADQAPAFGYRVRMFADDISDRDGHLYDEEICTVGPRTLSCTTRPLRAGLHYRFDIFSLDEDGLPSDPADTPLLPMKIAPVPPITLAEAGDGTARITIIDTAGTLWRQGDSFRVTRVDDFFGLVTAPACTIVRPDLTCTVTGLSNDAGYRFISTSINQAGESAPGLPSQVVEPNSSPAALTTPSAPLGASAITETIELVRASSSGSPEDIPAGTSLGKIPYVGLFDEEIWMRMNLKWDAPTQTGGARDIVYTATVTRIGGVKGGWQQQTGMLSNSCVTRERRCEIRFPYRTWYEYDSGHYVVSLVATTSAGSNASLWGLTGRGPLKLLATLDDAE